MPTQGDIEYKFTGSGWTDEQREILRGMASPVPQKPRHDKTIAIDFDGVLHKYSQGWQDGSIYDGPVPGAVAACHELARKYRLVIFTARQQEEAIKEWLTLHGFPPMEVMNTKPPALFYIDDRAIRFENWFDTLCFLDANAEHVSKP